MRATANAIGMRARSVVSRCLPVFPGLGNTYGFSFNDFLAILFQSRLEFVDDIMEISGSDFCEVGENVEFRLACQSDFKTVTLLISDPVGKEIVPMVKKLDDSTTRLVRFTTAKIGFYKINVVKAKLNNLLCSRTCFAYNLQKERWYMDTIQWSLEKIELIIEMRMHHPIVDYITANAHLLSSVNNTLIKHVVVKCDIIILQDKSCKVSFTPPQYGCYEIRFLCNNTPTPGPRPQVHVINRKKWKLIHSFTTDKGLTSISQKVSFIFELYGAPSEFLKAWVKCPDKSIVDMLLYGEEKNNKIGQLRCDFIPSTVGSHSLIASYQEAMFEKCPLEFYVYDRQMVELVSIDPDINAGVKPVVGQTITITYSGIYSEMEKISVNAVGSEDAGIYITVSVVKTEMDSKGIVTFSIKLHFAGQYLIEGYYNNQKINSFQVEVLPLLDIFQPNFSEPTAQMPGSIVERSREPPDIIVESISCDIEDKIPNFVEESLKSAIISITDECNISDHSNFPIVSGEGLVKAEVGKGAIFIVDPRQGKGKLTVDVIGPKSLAKFLIKPQSIHGRYEVEYYPEEVGLYQITILWNDRPIDGSPFEVEATDLASIQCISHQDVFSQVLSIPIGRKMKIDFSYSLAGNGRMSSCLKDLTDHTKIKIWTTVTKTVWSYYVEPSEEGVFEMEIFWNNTLLGIIKLKSEYNPDISIREMNDPVSQIILKGHGLKEAWVGEAAKFFVDTFNVGEGKLVLNLNGTTEEMESISVAIEVLPSGTYECSYQSSIPGEYLLHVSWGDQIVKGSPFPIVIKDRNPSRLVKCQGDGLKYGLVGEISIISIEISSQNVTESDDKNEIEATCFGPDNSPINCDLLQQNNAQYQVNLITQIPGRHQLNILYGNLHVIGSPFYPVFTDKANLENLEVFGPGLHSNELQNFQSYFTVDARKAGVGKLRVQVKGPKEAFRVEVQKDATDNRLIKCSYSPTETGEYTISINWNGFPIKGSPFQIILD